MSGSSSQYASADRLPVQLIFEDAQEFREQAMFSQLMDASPNVFFLLNEQRQIVCANQAALDFLKVFSEKDLQGQRPGEVVHCVFASRTSGGCGTTEYCRACGAVNAVLTALQGKPSTTDCRIRLNNGDALDLRISTTPVEFKHRKYVFCGILDIGAEKRKRVLERVFFHEVLQTAGEIKTAAGMLNELNPEEAKNLKQEMYNLAHEMVDTISLQKQILAAENRELRLDRGEIRVEDLFRDLRATYVDEPYAQGKNISISPRSAQCVVRTDVALLKRILGNMLRNGLEASQPGETVTLGAREEDTETIFTVHNSGVIERDIQLQIFQRSFSTKGPERGLGTYSMKLFGERYLNGRVHFQSDRAFGTTFFFFLPHEHLDTMPEYRP